MVSSGSLQMITLFVRKKPKYSYAILNQLCLGCSGSAVPVLMLQFSLDIMHKPSIRLVNLSLRAKQLLPSPVWSTARQSRFVKDVCVPPPIRTAHRTDAV